VTPERVSPRTRPGGMAVADTIVAIASPPGPGLRGLVRASGEGCLALLSPSAGLVEHPLGDASARRGAAAVRLRIPFAGVPCSLPAVLLTLPAPGSFTGEDSFELALPGHPALLEAAIGSLRAAGAAVGIAVRPADPGEFTRRAFERGRIDLSQAEGIALAIAAEGDDALAAARHLREGRLHREAEAVASGLADLLALVEAGIDFADEEDVVAIPAATLCDELAAIGLRVAGLLRGGAAAATDPRPVVVLCGPPNAGKSALFNALLGRRRSVESPVAGTTRDRLAEPLTIGPPGERQEILLVDAPGEETADGPEIDPIEAEMQAARSEAERHAALRLRCHPADAGTPPPPEGQDLLVVTKGDLDAAAAIPAGAVMTSARSGEGLASLREAIAGRLGRAAAPAAAGAVSLLERHRRHLEACAASIEEASGLAGAEASPELVAAILREAMLEAAAISGRIEPEDLLERIFSRFCIGK
jgi:tRNA modification GTPase